MTLGKYDLTLSFELVADRALRLRLMKAPPDVWLERVPDILVDDGEIEPFGVEMTTTPAPGVTMLRILSICHDLQKVLVTADTADIFRWPGAGTIDAGRCPWNRIEGEELLDGDDMLPVIGEVVEIEERELWVPFEIEKPDPALVEGTRPVLIFHFAKLLGIAVGQAADAKLMQMIVPPIEGGLNDKMQLSEAPGPRNDDTPPDRRFDPGNLDSDLKRVGFLEKHDGKWRC